MNVLNSVSSQLQMSQLSLENVEVVEQQETTKTKFEHILITKSEFDERQRKIKEIQTHIE